MSFECTLNKNDQVVGNPAFIISAGGAKGPNRAHHMLCTKCGHEYYQSQYATGRAQCPSCGPGSGSSIPPGATVAMSQIRRGDWINGGGLKPWPLVKPEAPLGGQVGSSATATALPPQPAVGDITTEEDNEPMDSATEDENPVRSPDDIYMEDEGLTVDAALVANADDIEVAAELGRSIVLKAMKANHKSWENTKESNKNLWRHVASEMVSIFGVKVDQGESDDPR